MAALRRRLLGLIALLVPLTLLVGSIPAHGVEVWQDPTRYGVFFVWYAPSFYTGYAPRCQDPGRIHIHLGRGNQLRVTTVLSHDIITHYLEDLIIRADMYQALVDKKIIQLTQKLTGHTAAAVAFGTEAPYLQQLGMQTVILGPGDIDQAHQPDEYLGLDRIKPSIDILKQLVNTICVSGNRLL